MLNEVGRTQGSEFKSPAPTENARPNCVLTPDQEGRGGRLFLADSQQLKTASNSEGDPVRGKRERQRRKIGVRGDHKLKGSSA